MNGYFDFLCREVGIGGPDGLPYRRLAALLYGKIFVCKLPNDMNRVDEAIRQRAGYSDAPKGSANVLEVLVSLCRQLTFMAEGMIEKEKNGADIWFDRIIENLGMTALMDDDWDEDFVEIAEAQIDRWMDRDYDYDGFGGAFPLDNPRNDQTEVELWYQMNAYLMEQIL